MLDRTALLKVVLSLTLCLIILASLISMICERYSGVYRCNQCGCEENYSEYKLFGHIIHSFRSETYETSHSKLYKLLNLGNCGHGNWDKRCHSSPNGDLVGDYGLQMSDMAIKVISDELNKILDKKDRLNKLWDFQRKYNGIAVQASDLTSR